MSTTLSQISPSQLHSLKQPALNVLQTVQPHGVLLVMQGDDTTILQTSNNTTDKLGLAPAELLGKTLEDILDSAQMARIQPGLEQRNLDLINPSKLWFRLKGEDYRVFDAIFHYNADGFLVAELEPASTYENIPFLSFYHLARASITDLAATSTLPDFYQTIVREIRNVTRFDRVMLYRFDEDGHGEVVAEEKLADLEPFMGLHFPESDIPQPARQMFLSNWIRVIPDATATPVAMYPPSNPRTQQPTDLTRSILRSPFACHTEYLHNMQVGASMTISLMKDQRLWGLIACHHRQPKQIPYELRKACEFLGQMIFAEISTRQQAAEHSYRLKLATVQSALVEWMSRDEHFIQGLTTHQYTLLDLTSATGAAICLGGQWTTIGRTPTVSELTDLAQWLQYQQPAEVFATTTLPTLYPPAEAYKAQASGLLAIPLAKQSYVMWFRPEVLQTVNWGGNPHQAFDLHQEGEEMRLCPRQSFALWQETVRLTALPWQAAEVQGALELRKAIVNIILRQAEELALLAQDLERSNAELKKFAYVASHDLQEPLNQVANYVQLLEMRYHGQLDSDASEFIDFAVEGVTLMQTLIDDVLLYSKVDMQDNDLAITDANQAYKLAIKNLRSRITETNAQITVDPLPTLMVDPTQLMQLFQNLIANALKFHSPNVPPQVHVSAQRWEDDWLFSVRDNGIGIDPQFHERIFVIFQRLHTRDEYSGSGMGLAICKKIAECHRGRIWVESALGQGSNFFFQLPMQGRERPYGSHKPQNYLLDRR
jgi:two-component system, chemotaxis family, sensor kinase Cph1